MVVELQVHLIEMIRSSDCEVGAFIRPAIAAKLPHEHFPTSGGLTTNANSGFVPLD
jgi:hypothetical protein